jgi:site-specific recombinase XerC
MAGHSLEYLLKGLMNHNRDGSYAVQDGRKSILTQAAKQLKEGGFRNMKPDSIKPKHVQFLVEKWQKDGLSSGTIKNRMSHLRWWAEKVGKSSMLPKSNSGANNAIKLNLEKRSHIPTESKRREIDYAKLNKITDKHVQYSLKMQAAFGLRREESIKFKPSLADKGDKISLKASWCKGGRARDIPVRTAEQRALLNEVRAFTANGALIPGNRNYVEQLKRYENQTAQVGMDKNHGLRHCYAQDRYQELTGWKSPIEGGIAQKEMSKEEREIDRAARMTITEELGHSREQITTSYLGR